MEIAFMAAVLGSLIYIQFQLHEIVKNTEPKDSGGDACSYKPSNGADSIPGDYGTTKIPFSDFPTGAHASIDHEAEEGTGNPEHLH